MTEKRLTRGVGLVALGLFCLWLVSCATERAETIPITTSSEEARQLYREGRDLAEKIRTTDARELYKQAVAKDDNFALAHLGLALTSPTAKEFFEALDRAVALADQVSEGERRIILGFQAGVNAEPETQKEHYGKLVEGYPHDERAHNLLAGLYFGRQEYETAIAHYKMATEENPNFSPPYNSLGYAYRSIERYPEAEEAFQKYIELIPDEPNPYDSYAELLMKMGRFEESIENYQKALSKDPKFVFSYVGIGNNHIFMGQPEEARKAFQELYNKARNEGEQRQALFWTAASHLYEGNYEQALSEVRKQYAIAQGTEDRATMSGDLNLMGTIYLEMGDLDSAQSMYRESVEVIEQADVPDDIKETVRRNHHYNEARLALLREDLETARAEAEEYRLQAEAKQIPSEIRLYHELAGRIALREGDYDTALAELKQGNQQNPQVLYLQALACQAKGDAEMAVAFCTKAAEFNGLSINYAYVRTKAQQMLKEG